MSEKENLSSRFKNLENNKSSGIEIKSFDRDDIIEDFDINQTNDLKEVNFTNIQEVYESALLDKINDTPVWFKYTKEKQQALIKNFINKKLETDNYTISDIDKELLIDNLKQYTFGFGEIQHLIDDDKISSIEINGNLSIYVKTEGEIFNPPINLNEKQLKFILKYISSSTGIEKFNGINNIKIENYLITIIGKDISNSGINITIKKQNKTKVSNLINKNILTENIYNFINSAINNRKNIIISGGINTYKTEILNTIITELNIDKKTYILTENPETYNHNNNISEFCITPNNEKYYELIKFIQKSEPEYIVTDINVIEPQLSPMDGKIVTLRAFNIDECLKFLYASYIETGIPEKFAKTMAYTDYDYIIQLKKDANNSITVSDVIELSPQRTTALSVKSIIETIENKTKKFITTDKKFKKSAKTLSTQKTK